MNLQQVRKLLNDPVEYEGFVHEKNGKLYFTLADHKLKMSDLLSGIPTFHTHNVKERDGGFQPPSIKDLKTIFKTNTLKTRFEHYIVTKTKIYRIKSLCSIKKTKQREILKEMRQLQLQQKTIPGSNYNKKILNLCKSHCLLIT